MNLRPFKYFRPATLGEFFEIINSFGPEEYVIMGGGSDILVKLKHRLIHPAVLISLSNLSELQTIAHDGSDIRIGAAVKLRRIKESGPIKKHLPALSQAAGWVASPQIRNMGTIGGNICLDTRCAYYNQPDWSCSFPPCFKRGGRQCHVVKKSTRCYALFCADTPPALLSLNARLVIADPSGKREILLSDFYKDDGLSCRNLSKNEVLVAVKIPVQNSSSSSYKRLSLRSAIEFPLAGVAVSRSNDRGAEGYAFRIAATSVQSQPIRLTSLERHLKNIDWADPDLGKTIAAELKEIKLVRHLGIPPSYRREMLKVLIEQNLQAVVRKGSN